MHRFPIRFALAVLALSGCNPSMNLSAHMTEGNITYTGTLTRGLGGSGRLMFAAPGGPNCDGVIVPSTARTPERLEGQIQCDDGRSGAIRMTLSTSLGVGSGRLGRDTITFRARGLELFNGPASSTEPSENIPTSRGSPFGAVTLNELKTEGFGASTTGADP